MSSRFPIVLTPIPPVSPSPRVAAKKAKKAKKAKEAEGAKRLMRRRRIQIKNNLTGLPYFLCPHICLILPSQSPRKSAKEEEEAEMIRWRLMKM